MSIYNYPFPTQPRYLALWLSYTNNELIADQVMPETPVEAETFKWNQYNKEDFFRITETQVGRLGQPNQVEFGGTEQTSFVVDHGLDAFVPQKDIDNAPLNLDPRAQHILGITERVKLAREKRVADLLFTSTTYPAANRQTLSGSTQFSHADSDPFDLLMTAMDGMLMRPNIGIISRPAWTKLRRNTKLTAALASPAGGNTSTTNASGAPASLQAVAELLELDRIYVGAAFSISSKEGQTPVYTRLWGNHMALLHQRPLASLRSGGITFGATASYGPPVAGTMFDPTIGLKGAYRCRAGNSLRELVIASDAGYFFQNVI
jgi:hypothetical protein